MSSANWVYNFTSMLISNQNGYKRSQLTRHGYISAQLLQKGPTPGYITSQLLQKGPTPCYKTAQLLQNVSTCSYKTSQLLGGGRELFCWNIWWKVPQGWGGLFAQFRKVPRELFWSKNRVVGCLGLISKSTRVLFSPKIDKNVQKSTKNLKKHGKFSKSERICLRI